MLSSIGNINLMRNKVVSGGGGSSVWMIGNSDDIGNINVSINNGTSWTSYNSSMSIVFGITYGLTSTGTPLWVATGSQNIATSTNSGVTWSSVPSVSMTNNIYCAGYGKNNLGTNLFMVGGYSTTGNIIFSSSNGTTWTGVMGANSTMNSVYGIKYGQLSDATPGTGIWIAVGIAQTGGAGLAYSTNGSTWTGVNVSASFPNSNNISDIAYGIDNTGTKRWVVGSDHSVASTVCIRTLSSPASASTSNFATWSSLPSASLMTGKCFSVTFGRSGVSGNVFVATGGVGIGTGNAIVTYDGSVATGYIQIPGNSIPYQGCQVGYLNSGDGNSSAFYTTVLNQANQLYSSRYGNSWTNATFNYVTSGNTINGKIISSISY